MASTPLTLAALATSAVPDLVVHGTREHETSGDGEFASAVLVCEHEDLIVRVPRTQSAEVQQSAELLALAALTAGARARLPFAVSEPRGLTRAGDSRAVVSTFLAGEHIAAQTLDPEALLLQSLAEALAAIHDLPHGVAQQHGLTLRSADDARLEAARLVERAEATRLLPSTVSRRWIDTLKTPELWDFSPTVVHGSLSIEQLLVVDDRVEGILGWAELSVGDPAIDLAWLLGSGPGVLEQVLTRYAALRSFSSLDHLRDRITLYHELEVARWLLHGVESHDESIIDDAVAMLDELVDEATHAPQAKPVASVMSDFEVSEMLDGVPQVSSALSDTAAYEALEEDRMFHVDTDFIEPLEQASDEQTSGEQASGEQVDHDELLTAPLDTLDLLDPLDAVDSGAVVGSPEESASADQQLSSEHPTQAIDPDLLPPRDDSEPGSR